ncbi:hypothetical protein [Shouchella patagoniensis]|uniref:hypothetical protein n=1 Tax=Shouchella patagoniensis TaxID=228576 RepID=UPI0014737E2C
MKKIHIIISSQSCLPFELGKQLTTDTYMKELITYQYSSTSSPVYPWGISFTSQGVKYVEWMPPKSHN